MCGCACNPLKTKGLECQIPEINDLGGFFRPFELVFGEIAQKKGWAATQAVIPASPVSRPSAFRRRKYPTKTSVAKRQK
jgi:hypothetical protein